MNNQQQRNSASESSGQVDTNTSVIVDRANVLLNNNTKTEMKKPGRVSKRNSRRAGYRNSEICTPSFHASVVMRGTRAGMHASITSKLGSVRNFTNMFDNVSKSTRDVESGNGDPRLKPYRYITLRSKPADTSTITAGLFHDSDNSTHINAILDWTCRVSFSRLLGSFLLLYITSVTIFAVLLFVAMQIDEGCAGDSIGGSNSTMIDLMQLSWNTFSTVGYGHIHPYSSAEYVKYNDVHQSDNACIPVIIVTALEAYIGILYGGFCCAILFAKTTRAQREAQVLFADPICVRFGQSLSTAADHEVETDDRLPCPVIEFEILNKHANTRGGALLDAKVSCVIGIDSIIEKDLKDVDYDELSDEDDVYSIDSDGSSNGKDKYSNNGTSQCFESAPRKYSGKGPQAVLRNLRKRRTKSGGGGVSFGAGIINGLRRTNADQKTRSIGAFKEGKLVQHRTMFTPLNFESSDHPFFQRAWIVGHRLDSDSPLLTKAVRHEIAKNHGSWPKQLNNYEGIRGSLRKFDRLLLSINATSDISGCDVSSRKTYSFSDIVIGYHHAEVTWISEKGNLRVDLNVVHDVREQECIESEPVDGIKPVDGVD